MNISILLVAFAVAAVSAAPEWDGLRTTWSANPFGTYGFNAMPRTTSDVGKEGFVLVDSFCGSDKKFRGNRYRKDGDAGFTLLFDKNGFIAGSQISVPKSAYTPPETTAGHPFVDDGDYYTLTTYFVDPAIICDPGRTMEQFGRDGTGDRLIIQNGTNALTDGISIPRDQADIEGKTMWTRGKCFWTMGLHFWYNSRVEMSCDEWFPFFLLYNKNRLTAFGYATPSVGKLTCPRYEHPSNFQAKTCCLEPFPDCFYTDPAFTVANTLHVYLIDSPRSTSFC